MHKLFAALCVTGIMLAGAGPALAHKPSKNAKAERACEKEGGLFIDLGSLAYACVLPTEASDRESARLRRRRPGSGEPEAALEQVQDEAATTTGAGDVHRPLEAGQGAGVDPPMSAHIIGRPNDDILDIMLSHGADPEQAFIRGSEHEREDDDDFEDHLPGDEPTVPEL